MRTELLFILLGLAVGLLIVVPSLTWTGPTANRRVRMTLVLPIAIFVSIAVALFPPIVQVLRDLVMAAIVWSIAVALVVLVYVLLAARRIASQTSSRRSSSDSHDGRLGIMGEMARNIMIGALIAAVLTLITALVLISQIGFPLWILLVPGLAVLLCVGYGAAWQFAKHRGK